MLNVFEYLQAVIWRGYYNGKTSCQLALGQLFDFRHWKNGRRVQQLLTLKINDTKHKEKSDIQLVI